jgi:hypothetical protein
MAQKALWPKGNAPVAQWIEQWIPNPFVGCSIHPGGTSYLK